MATDLRTILHERLVNAIRAALGDGCPADVDPLLAAAKNPKFGDFQSNAAMGLAKRIGKNPREVAEAVVACAELDDIAEPPTIAGPGFINIRLRNDAVSAALDGLDDTSLGIEPVSGDQKKTVVVDLCGVNLAKQMHVGHIRATVIGDALARLNERLGHRVFRQNHFGDWGLPIAMVTERVKRLESAGEVTLDTLTLPDLERHYRAAQAESGEGRGEWNAIQRFQLGPKAEAEWEDSYERGAAALSAAKSTLVALQSGDADTVRVWERIALVTLDACFENCRTLQANVTEEATAGESTYRDQLADVVEQLVRTGAAEESEGALVVRLDDAGINQPCLVRKSDGGYLYATFDLAAIRHRVQTLGADLVLYAVDVRQGLHFRQVFEAARKGGLLKKADGSEATLVHAAFGTILGKDNKPFKTRSGETVKLADLLDEAVERARRAVDEKNPDLPSDERERVAHDVAVAAIKYADLSSDRVKDYVFDFDQVVAFEGATGPYLQYALVRVKSILRNAAERGVDRSAWEAAPLLVEAPEERALALTLLAYPEVVRGAAAHAEPHRVCGYAYELANAFSSFFAACPVLQAEDVGLRRARLRMTALVGGVLEDALSVLGIPTPERM